MPKQRALMSATVPSMIGQFNMNNIKLLIDLGYQIDVACDFDNQTVWSFEKTEQFKNSLRELNVGFYQISFARNVFDIKSHLTSYRQIKKILNDNKYSLIHTHTPISSLILRIANKKCDYYDYSKMIYTAHGFHFFQGNSYFKNLLFKTIEKYGAKFTDVLITINQEDYKAAKAFKLKPYGKTYYMHGIGVDIDRIKNEDCKGYDIKNELGLPSDCKILLSVGELNDNKNHKIVIEALKELPLNYHYVICGVGALRETYIELAKSLGIEERVHLVGYRNDVIKIMNGVDYFVFPSKREGLPVSLIEAMACGLTCIVSNIRGNQDLIDNGINGYIFDLKEFKEKLSVTILNDSVHPVSFANINQQILKEFSKEAIVEEMLEIYSKIRTKEYDV